MIGNATVRTLSWPSWNALFRSFFIFDVSLATLPFNCRILPCYVSLAIPLSSFVMFLRVSNCLESSNLFKQRIISDLMQPITSGIFKNDVNSLFHLRVYLKS